MVRVRQREDRATVSRNFLLFGQRQYLIHDAVFHCLPGAHEEIAFGIVPDAFERLPGMVLDDLVEHITGMQEFASMDIDVGNLSTNTTLNPWLVNVNAGMWQGAAPAMVTGHQQDGAEAGSVSYTSCG